MTRSKIWLLSCLVLLLLAAGSLAIWYGRSRKANVNVSVSTQEAFETYRAAAGVPYLGDVSAAASSAEGPVATAGSDGRLQVGFPPSLLDPGRGEFVAVALHFTGLRPQTAYLLAFEVGDRYTSDLPGRLMQMVWLDDRLVYANDLGAGTFTGVRSVEWPFRASSSRAELRVEVRTIGDAEKGWAWGNAARIDIGRLRLEPVDSAGGQPTH